MDLSYAFFAKAAQFSDDGLGVIGGELQSLQGLMPFSPDALTLVVKMEFVAEECGRPYHFQIEVVDPEGRTVSIEPPLEITPPHPRQNDRMKAILLFDLTNTNFSQPGLFQFRLLMDGALLRTLELTIQAIETVEPVETA